MKPITSLLVACLCSFVVPGNAVASIVEVDEGQRQIDISVHWRYLASQNTDVHAPPSAQLFVESKSPGDLAARQAYWFLVRLENVTSAAQQRLLHLDQPWIKRAVLFVIHERQAPNILLSGYEQYASNTALPTTEPLFELTLEPGVTELYLLVSNTQPNQLRSLLSDTSMSAKQIAQRNLRLGTLFGILLLLGSISLLVGTTGNHHGARLLGFFAGSLLIVALTLSGIGQVYLWRSVPELTTNLFGPGIAALCACLYAMQLHLLSPPRSSKTYIVNRIGLIYAAVVALPLNYAGEFTEMLCLPLLIPILAGLIRAMREQQPPARRYLVAMLPTIAAGAAMASEWSGIDLGLALAAGTTTSLLFAGFMYGDLLRDWLQLRDARHSAIIAKFKAKQADHDLRHVHQESQAKSAFLTTMSHDIRTPMNGILGIGDLLQQTRLDEQQQHYVNTLRRSGESLLEILNDALDLSKIEAGRLRLEPTPCDLQEIVASATNRCEMDVRINIDAQVQTKVSLDGPRLQQILNNLITHLRTHEAASTICMNLSAPKHHHGVAQQIKIEVKTNTSQNEDVSSSGAHSASQSNRIDPTQRLISIANSLVELMGGKMYVKPVDGKTEFCFNIEAPAISSADAKHPFRGDHRPSETGT